MFKSIALLFVLAIAVSSCSKEKKLTKRLDGTWNIDEVTYRDYEDGALDPFFGSFTFPNAGTITLNKDNTGSITFSLPGIDPSTAQILDWSNTETTVQIISREPNSTVNDTMVFDVVVNEKNKQEWFNADPSKTDPDRTEMVIKLSAK